MSAAPAPRTPPPALQAIFNRVFRVVLSSPLHGLLSKNLVLISFTGRRSGRRFITPVAYAQDGDTVLFSTNRPWYKNLAGGPIELRLRGQRRTGQATIISDEAGLTTAYGVLLRNAPQLGRFTGVTADTTGRPDPATIRTAQQRGFVVVAVQLGAA